MWVLKVYLQDWEGGSPSPTGILSWGTYGILLWEKFQFQRNHGITKEKIFSSSLILYHHQFQFSIYLTLYNNVHLIVDVLVTFPFLWQNILPEQLKGEEFILDDSSRIPSIILSKSQKQQLEAADNLGSCEEPENHKYMCLSHFLRLVQFRIPAQGMMPSQLAGLSMSLNQIKNILTCKSRLQSPRCRQGFFKLSIEINHPTLWIKCIYLNLISKYLGKIVSLNKLIV